MIHKEPSIFEKHLSVLEEIVEDWQHIPFAFFDALDDKDSSFYRCLYYKKIFIDCRTISDLPSS